MLSLLISIDLTPLFLLQIIIHYIITFFINKTILFMHNHDVNIDVSGIG